MHVLLPRRHRDLLLHLHLLQLLMHEELRAGDLLLPQRVVLRHHRGHG
jgi:hypothetical protein